MIIRWQRFWAYLRGLDPGYTVTYPQRLAWRLMEAVLLLLDCLYLPEMALLVHQVCKPRTRRLYPQEIALAQNVFGNSIQYAKVRLDEHARLVCRRQQLAYVSFQMINTWGPLSEPHFIHEMVHVWQYQHRGSVYIPRALYAQRTTEGYNYGGIPGLRQATEQGRGLADFNFEQQGDVVADYFCLKHGYPPRWCPADPMYIADFERVIGITFSVLNTQNT